MKTDGTCANLVWVVLNSPGRLGGGLDKLVQAAVQVFENLKIQ